MKTNTPPNTTHTAADTIIPRYLHGEKRRVDWKSVEGLLLLVGEIVVVCWDDAQTVASDWESHDGDGYGVCDSVSAGFLWEVEETHLTLMGTLNATHHTAGLTIPLGCVTDMWTAVTDDFVSVL
jgi:hypothetical protein